MEDYNFNLEKGINQEDNNAKSNLNFNNLWREAEKKQKIEIIILAFLVLGTVFFLLSALFSKTSEPEKGPYSPELKQQILNP